MLELAAASSRQQSLAQVSPSGDLIGLVGGVRQTNSVVHVRGISKPSNEAAIYPPNEVNSHKQVSGGCVRWRTGLRTRLGIQISV